MSEVKQETIENIVKRLRAAGQVMKESGDNFFQPLGEHYVLIAQDVEEAQNAVSNAALTESQARAARLEEALKELVSQINEFANKWGEADFYTGDAIKALADSPNWLQERLKAERERAAKVCDDTDLEDDRNNGDAATGAAWKCAAAIRALPEGE